MCLQKKNYWDQLWKWFVIVFLNAGNLDPKKWMNTFNYFGSPFLVTDLMSPWSEVKERPFTKSLKKFTRGTKAAK